MNHVGRRAGRCNGERFEYGQRRNAPVLVLVWSVLMVPAQSRGKDRSVVVPNNCDGQ